MLWVDNCWEKPCIVHGVGDTVGWESDGKKYPYFRESMGTNFPGSLNSMDFTAFSNAMGNSWGNLSISHVMKYITGWESVWRNASILWEKYEYHNFPGFPLGFVTFSRAIGNSWRNPSISHMMKYATRWESNGKNHSYHRKNMGTNVPGFTHLMVLPNFPMVLEID